ncbi:MAG TPA: aldolase/citrate lyase family protein [Spirochaetia bacterium]|nr:aldolase/citrate lyase family protein [Spirochaetia bacterium]
MAATKLRAGGKAVGTMVRLVRSPGIALIAKNAGLDFFMFDLEHGSFSLESVADAAAAARSAGISCFARVPELSKAWVSRILDCGCTGVMVPMIESVEQAQKLAGWAKFAPIGYRGMGSAGGHTDYASIPAPATGDFMQTQNESTLAIAQIETKRAIEEIDKIASVPGIDVLLIGPNDLAVSLGISGDLQNPKLVQSVEAVAAAASKHGKIFGMHGPDALTELFLPKGLRMIMSALDIGMLGAAMKAIAVKYGK